MCLMRESKITPVHKKGPTNILRPTSYRPISVTCMSPMLESKINTHYYILSDDQHGFTHGCSTCTNLLECLNDVTCIRYELLNK